MPRIITLKCEWICTLECLFGRHVRMDAIHPQIMKMIPFRMDVGMSNARIWLLHSSAKYTMNYDIEKEMRGMRRVWRLVAIFDSPLRFLMQQHSNGKNSTHNLFFGGINCVRWTYILCWIRERARHDWHFCAHFYIFLLCPAHGIRFISHFEKSRQTEIIQLLFDLEMAAQRVWCIALYGGGLNLWSATIIFCGAVARW